MPSRNGQDNSHGCPLRLRRRRSSSPFPAAFSSNWCPSGNGLADNVFIVVVVVIVMVIVIAGSSVFFDYDCDNDNRFADNDLIQQSCFRLELADFSASPAIRRCS
jgi:hypothetical protein